MKCFVTTSRVAAGVLLSMVLLVNLGWTQSSPKREFRGAWIATVTNLDWPSSPGLPVAEQKSQLITILNSLKAAGINAVVFQVRTECDAFYNSSIDPWSYWLTGVQGQAPSPLYDPLQFAIGEAHARGMELHAWFNPYRAIRNVSGTYPQAANHVSVAHPDWLLYFPDANHKIVNPGLPQVRDYVAGVVADIVRRYDVDGVHADDYFYPYPASPFPGITTEDTATFAMYPNGFIDIKDWRRDNVNRLLQQIHDSIQVIKPHVKFGMSPFGIWRSGVPSGIFGLDAYNQIFADAIAWLQAQSIDYLTPQLYWPFGGGQDYGLLQPWWADSTAANGRHLYTGNAPYRIGTSFGDATQMKAQIEFNRANPKVQGSVQFRANFIRDNVGGWTDLMKSDVFRNPAAVPVMGWKETVAPHAPGNLTVDSSGALFVLKWDPPSPAADSDTAARYLVYRFKSADTTGRENSSNLIAFEGVTTSTPSGRVDTTNAHYYFAVSALDKNNNESGLTNLVTFGAPVNSPTLADPADSGLFAKTGQLKWTRPSKVTGFLVRVSRSSDFHRDSLITTISTADTFSTLAGLVPQKMYYWKAAAGGQAGTSDYTPAFRFTAGWPYPPTIVSPVAVTNVAVKPTFVWNKGTGTSYLARVIDAATSATVFDTTVTDTTFVSSRTLAGNKIYRWKVMSQNAYGSSDWSAEGSFRTILTLVEHDAPIPATYNLSQNYPNPFNPVTEIRFALPDYGLAQLKVYDILGRAVAVLVNEELPPGTYVTTFDADRLPSGTYFAVFTAGEYRFVRKMLLVK